MARDGSQFLNAHVFPGGQAEDSDAGNIQRTALRELYEEAAIHFRPSDESRRVIPKAVRVNTTQTSFAEYLQQTKEEVAEDKLIPYSRWITPKMMPKRFDTTFFLALAMPSDNPVEGKADAQEITSLTWMSPSEALSQFSAGKITLFPPQWYLSSPQKTFVNWEVHSLRSQRLDAKVFRLAQLPRPANPPLPRANCQPIQSRLHNDPPWGRTLRTRGRRRPANTRSATSCNRPLRGRQTTGNETRKGSRY
jgi:8-oxo-dGTP pyrophosphatase MutT (NUDIX family)